MSGSLIYIVPTSGSVTVYKIRPHHCAEGPLAGFPQTTEKGRSSYGNVKMSLNIGAMWLVLSGEEKETGCELKTAAVSTVPRTGKSVGQTCEEQSPS